MKLYHHPLSIFARRVRMQLHEKGVTIDEVLVDMAAKEHKSEAYRALNPYARVPVLVDGDFVLYESSAIMEYLEHVFPAPPLVPPDAKGRALVSMHVKLCDLEVGTYTRALFFPRRFLPRERWDVASQEQARASIAQHLAILSKVLGERTYLIGDFTLADIAYCGLAPFLDLFELEPPANVAAWLARIEARPSAIATQLPR